MTYTYREDISYADIAFDAEGKTLEELFQNAGDALAEVMVNNLDQVKTVEIREVQFQSESSDYFQGLEELLYELLQSMIYWKDVDLLTLRVKRVNFLRTVPGKKVALTSVLAGERMDSARHKLGSDVKAVTYHHLKVFRDKSVWRASVVLDT